MLIPYPVAILILMIVYLTNLNIYLLLLMANKYVDIIINFFILFISLKIFKRGGIFTKPDHQINEYITDNKVINELNNVIPEDNTNGIYNYSSYIYRKKNESCCSLGTKTWSLLHSIAAAYPNKPTQIDKNSTKQFFDGLFHFFPSKLMKDIYSNNPIENDSREELIYYVCLLHNLMNKQLNKAKFRCLDAFDVWGGDCGCNE